MTLRRARTQCPGCGLAANVWVTAPGARRYDSVPPDEVVAWTQCERRRCRLFFPVPARDLADPESVAAGGRAA